MKIQLTDYIIQITWVSTKIWTIKSSGGTPRMKPRRLNPTGCANSRSNLSFRGSKKCSRLFRMERSRISLMRLMMPVNLIRMSKRVPVSKSCPSHLRSILAIINQNSQISRVWATRSKNNWNLTNIWAPSPFSNSRRASVKRPES